jgi:hypothetical protein
MGYQARDHHIIDYAIYELPGVRPHPGDGRFRGPPLQAGPYIACVGAAQTFGCFCPEPFPVLLGRALRVQCLNLGYGGAGPTFHRSNPGIMGYVNRAALVIVQVLSGRSESNSAFRITDHGMEGIRVADAVRMTAEEFYTALLREAPDDAPRIVAETRENYVRDMTTLLRDIAPPKILLWFSVRRPEYVETYELPIWKLWGQFPQFVNREMVDRLAPLCDAYVKCVSRDGLPQTLYDRAGDRTSISYRQGLVDDRTVVLTENSYYPSPEMHASAAALLAPFCRSLGVGADESEARG